MTIFSAIGIAGTGVTVYRKWLDAVADNVANMNDAQSTSGQVFRARYVQARAVDYGTGEGGAVVAGTALGDPKGRLVYEPENPLADREGYVKYPDIDLGSQMTQMIMAQRAYQANLTVVDRAKDAYQAAIQIGKG
ncbi:flagellar basal body rod protein FlgC [Dactylosporangium maewongense]|uniref:Flagellar basal body rod protein FlgC n=2 Tax=Dactylosporangium TaxID=35753 RepID=A0ABN2DGA5_9ACTN